MYKHATTEDFKNACENTSGMNLDFFFDQWVYDEYYPKYEYSFHQDDSTLATTVQIEQTQERDGWRAVFEMPVQLKIHYKDHSDSIITVWNDQQIQSFTLDLKKPISFIFFDPDNWILKEAKYELWTGVADDLTDAIPLKYNLQQNYPNPFNSSTTIQFALPKSAFVTLKVYNLLGEEVATLVAEQRAAGIHRFNWDARGLASGVYLYRMEVGDNSPNKSGRIFVQSKKLILIQ